MDTILIGALLSPTVVLVLTEKNESTVLSLGYQDTLVSNSL